VISDEKSSGSIRINEIDANEVVLDEDLPFTGLGDWQISLVLQHLCTTRLLSDDTLHLAR
jgi:hypothetical protein